MYVGYVGLIYYLGLGRLLAENIARPAVSYAYLEGGGQPVHRFHGRPPSLFLRAAHAHSVVACA
jgi:hypothetical protein